MGLIRFLLIVIVIWLAYNYIKRWLNSPSQKPRARKPKQVETIVACHKCGLHIPQHEAIESRGNYYCSESHRDEDLS